MKFGGFERFTLIDYPGKVAAMVYTIGCNFRCPYCHNPELVDQTVEDTINENEVLSFLEKRKIMLDGLVITGGEPTMHGKELITFIKKVKEKGYLVKLDSNGTDTDFLKKVINEKLVDYIAMDIKSPMEKYAETVARPVDVENIKKSIELLINSDIDYEFRTTLIKTMVTRDDLKQMAKEIKGAKAYYLQKFIPTKILNPQFKKKTTYSDDELKEIQKEMQGYVKKCEIR